MNQRNTNSHDLKLKKILLINKNVTQLGNEINFLCDKGISILEASGSEQAMILINSNINDIDLILLDPVLSSLSEGIETAKNILSLFDIPILFYTDHKENNVISALDEIDHYGVVLISSGPVMLYSSLIRISKAIKKYKSIFPLESALDRLVKRIQESNKINQKSDYGYLTAELVDAIIIDDKDGNIITANNKACQILGLSLDQIINRQIYNQNWEFLHEDLTPFTAKEHPHIVAAKTKESQKNIIMGIKRTDVPIQWLSNTSLPIFTSDGKELEGVATYFHDITDLIFMKQNNFRWTSIFNNADWGIVTGNVNSKNLDMMNPAYAKMHGYTIEELKGKPVIDVFAPHERESVPEHIELAHQKGHHRFEAWHIKKDGTTFPAINDVTTIKDAKGNALFRAVNVIDISERRKQELILNNTIKEKQEILKEFKKAKEYSETLFNDSPIAIYSIDKNGIIVDFNKMAEKITGFNREEIIGRDFSIVNEKPKRKNIQAEEYTIRTKDNKEKIIERYNAILKDKEGKVVGEIKSFIDITSWKELEDFKSDIERIIRHDLKTPLNSIIGFPKMMLTDESLSDEYKEYLMIILSAGQNMLNLINASLNMYKLEEGSYQLEMKKTNVISTLKQISNELREIRNRKNCKIDISLNDIPIGDINELHIETEKSLFYMIMTNIIKNALEASPKGENVQVEIKEGERLTISVHNLGIIPHQIQEKFFEKYITLGKSSGNGLGTYSAKLMANAIKADLYFETNEKNGTTLFLKL